MATHIYNDEQTKVTAHGVQMGDLDSRLASQASSTAAQASSMPAPASTTAPTQPQPQMAAPTQPQPQMAGQEIAPKDVDADNVGLFLRQVAERELERNKPEILKDQKRRERRERSKRIISAVGDGIANIANLYYTSQYAPDAHPGNAMTEATDARLEKLRADRDKRHDTYLAWALRLKDMYDKDKAAAAAARQQVFENGIKQGEYDLKVNADKRAEDKHPHEVAKMAGEAEEAGAKAITARTEAEYAPKIAQGEVGLNNARIATEASKQAHNYASAGAQGALAGKYAAEANKTNSGYATFDGKTYTNKADYDRAVVTTAEGYNKCNPATPITTRVKKNGKFVPRSTHDLAAVVEVRLAQERATPPSQRNQQK